MFKKIMISLSAFVLMLTPMLAVNAVNLDSAGLLKKAQKSSGYAEANETSLSENIGKVLSIALSLIGTIFTVLIVYSGFKWMTAQGDSSKIDVAKNTLISSVIGLVIVLAAYSISNFVVSKLVENTLT